MLFDSFKSFVSGHGEVLVSNAKWRKRDIINKVENIILLYTLRVSCNGLNILTPHEIKFHMFPSKLQSPLLCRSITPSAYYSIKRHFVYLL